MRSKIILAGTSAILAAGALVIVACQDSPTTLKPSHKANVRVTATASATRARIHQRNPHEWAGVAHNRALDDWRREMRKPGVLTQNLCSYVTDFATRNERLPAGKGVPLPLRRRAIGAAIKDSKLCQAMVAKGSFSSSLASRRNGLRQGSAALSTAQAQIESAIGVAENSYDLAARLNTVLDGATALDEVEQTVVAATVSVTQNSYEYWESEFSAVVQELVNEYGACASERRAAGYGMDAARDACLSGEAFDVKFRGWSPNSFLGPRLTPSASRSLFCGPRLREGFRHIAYGDSRGAFAGGFAGAFAAGPAGIVGGALVGGMSGSIWAAGENAWSTFWCIMEQ